MVRRVCVILNEGGGTVQREGADRQAKALAASFAERGIEAVMIFAAGEDLSIKARAALGDERGEGRFDGIVAAGGDGSVNAVAGALAGTAMPLGVLPLGTLNHFAQDLGLPSAVDAAVEVIAAGHVRRVDVAEVNGRVFVNNSSIGLYPYMVADRDRQRSDIGRGKWPAMLIAFVRALRRFPRRRLAIRAAGWSRPCRTPCVFVGNNEYEFDLLMPGKRPVLDTGKLCLYVLNHRSPWGLLNMALRAAAGRLDQARDFAMLRGLGEVEIVSRASRLPVALDGEVAVLRPPLRYRSRPRALRVFAPAPG